MDSLVGAIIPYETSLMKLQDYIEKSTVNVDVFLDVLKLDYDFIETSIFVKEAVSRNIIQVGNDNTYFNKITEHKLGKTVTEVIKFYNDPRNLDLLGIGGESDSPTSLRKLLKQD